MPGHQVASSGPNSISPHVGGHAPPRSKAALPKKQHHDRPGERPVAASIEKSEKSEKKNVSHVPCKFFRQSICQAGDKCPFSHELDSQTQAVCKYYQKGNCKFGAKCALAHITADGRQVNKKPPKEPKDLPRRKDRLKDEQPGEQSELSPSHPRPKTGSASSQASDTTVVDSSVQMASRILSKYSGSGQPAAGPAPVGSLPSHITPLQQQPVAPSASASVSTAAAASAAPPQSMHIPNGVQPGSPRMNLGARPFTARSLSSSLPQTPASQRFAQFGSLSFNNPPSGSLNAVGVGMSPPLSHSGLQGSAWTSYRSLFEGSAITDDDEDTLEEGDLLEEEEEGFREQLVPSTLTDLLTPLERERRNSRNSAQKSGRVFSSPTSVSSPFGFGMRRASSGAGSSHEVLSSSAPQQDLWGPRPRNQVFPIQRPSGTPQGLKSGDIATAPIGTQFEHSVPPLDMDGAYQPFQQFNRAIAR